MSRLAETFARLRAAGTPGLVTFATAGDPTLERSAEVLGAVKQSAALDGLLKTRLASLDASKSCARDVGCMVATFKWTDKDAREAGAALGALYGSSAAVRSWVDELKLSGMYVRYNAQPGAQFLASAWEDCYKGLNHALDVVQRYLGACSFGDPIAQLIRSSRASGAKATVRLFNGEPYVLRCSACALRKGPT